MLTLLVATNIHVSIYEHYRFLKDNMLTTTQDVSFWNTFLFLYAKSNWTFVKSLIFCEKKNT